MSGSAKAGTTAERHTCELESGLYVFPRSSQARVGRSAFSLDFRLTSITARQGPETPNGCPVLRRQEPRPRGTRASWNLVYTSFRAPPKRASGEVRFLLTFDLHGGRPSGDYPDLLALEIQG